ncbi:MAG: hypothetical protein QM820_24065 [Minicystis sp.]
MASAKDEVARRSAARRDPRVDPDSVPAMKAVTEKAPAKGKSPARDEVAPRGKKRDPRAESDSVPAMRAVSEKDAAERDAAEEREAAVDVEVDAGEEPGAEAANAAEPVAAAKDAETSSTHADPRFAELEPLFDRSAWKDIADRLGPPEKAAELPPALALVYALARREAAGDEVARGATELAIKSMAALLGVAPDSATALVLAKRLLRQNPASWRTRPAPPARLSVAIVLLGVAVGVAVGSFLSLDAFRSFKLF